MADQEEHVHRAMWDIEDMFNDQALMDALGEFHNTEPDAEEWTEEDQANYEGKVFTEEPDPAEVKRRERISRMEFARSKHANPRVSVYARKMQEHEASLQFAADLEAEAAEQLQNGSLFAGLTFSAGGDFVLDTTALPSAVWGFGSEVLWPEGESLIIAGDQGLGKTTLAQQIALGRIGCAGYSTMLGYPIVQSEERVLYLAMDRPRQAARSLARMVGEKNRSLLNERMAVWLGPPPADFATNTETLLRLAKAANATTVIVDSVKDAAIGLADEKVGAGYNRARQRAIAEGIEVLELHHTRKTDKGMRLNIADIFGSKWITAGSGSVLLLDGDPGDPIVTCNHVKFPVDQVGPLTLSHDHPKGRTEVHQQADLIGLAHEHGGVSAQDAAKAMFTTGLPTTGQIEKARRKLDALVMKGQLAVDKTIKPHVWRPAK